jgi:uncharacterized membrane protein YozB (DUF420 family)
MTTIPTLKFLLLATYCRVENGLTRPHKEAIVTAVQLLSTFKLLYFYINTKRIFERKNEIMSVIA